MLFVSTHFRPMFHFHSYPLKTFQHNFQKVFRMLVILLFVSASAVSHRQGFYQYVFIKNRLNKNCPLKCRCYEIDIHRKNNRKLHSLYGLVYLFFFLCIQYQNHFFCLIISTGVFITRQLSIISEADLGLLQHSRWSSL